MSYRNLYYQMKYENFCVSYMEIMAQILLQKYGKFPYISYMKIPIWNMEFSTFHIWNLATHHHMKYNMFSVSQS